jgi:hypothetical protein
MSRRTPFYLALCIASLTQAQELPPHGPLPEKKSADIGFRSVAEALTSLKARGDVTVSTVRDWTIIVDNTHKAVWSFAPPSSAAYPAVVKREVRSRPEGGSEIHMSVLCEATKEACDNLVREFDTMNKRI